jgi:predicted enzyme related to lactoylglutathione lyase
VPEVGRFAVIADPQGAVLSAYEPAGEPPAGEGTFVWDELLTTDVEGAKRFYGEVFGWAAADMDMGGGGTYTMFKRAGDTDAAGLMRKPDEQPGPPAWLTYLGTDDVDATVAKAGDLGGTTFMAARDIPNVGRFAVLADPTGAVFALFKRAAA